MTKLNNAGYITRLVGPGSNGTRGTYREWWLVKALEKGKDQVCCRIALGTITLPISYVGKKIRFKLEVIEDDEHV